MYNTNTNTNTNANTNTNSNSEATIVAARAAPQITYELMKTHGDQERNERSHFVRSQ